MDSEKANFYFTPTQFRTLYLRIVSKCMLTGKCPNQLRHGRGFIYEPIVVVKIVIYTYHIHEPIVIA